MHSCYVFIYLGFTLVFLDLCEIVINHSYLDEAKFSNLIDLRIDDDLQPPRTTTNSALSPIEPANNPVPLQANNANSLLPSLGIKTINI